MKTQLVEGRKIKVVMKKYKDLEDECQKLKAKETFARK